MPRFADMFVDLDKDPRTEPPAAGGELELLTGFLRWQRETLELKCAGLDAASMARRSVEFSSLSLLGLVRHMAEIERRWFRERLAGLHTPRHFCSDDDPDGDFDGAKPDPALVTEAWEVWRAEVAFAERFVAQAPSLDITEDVANIPGNEPRTSAVSLRWVLIHMIEEYARHMGHADLLRQGIDGAVGQ